MTRKSRGSIWNWIKFALERTFTYAVALSTSSVMLYGLIRIFMTGSIKFIEPNRLILVSEIFMLSVGLIYIFRFIINDIIKLERKKAIIKNAEILPTPSQEIYRR